MLAGFLGVSTAQSISLAEDVDIEMASGELSEQQCQEVSLKVALDMGHRCKGFWTSWKRCRGISLWGGFQGIAFGNGKAVARDNK